MRLQFGVRVLDRFLSLLTGMLLVAVAAASDDVAATSARTAKVGPTRRRCCAGSRRPRPRSSSRGCPVSCRSGRSASAGRRCGELPAPAADRQPDDRSRSSRRSPRSERSTGARLAGAPATAARPACSPPRPSASRAFLRGLLGGELRQGALLGVMTDAVAHAADVPPADVRRAAMLRGDLPAVAAAALAAGAFGARRLRLEVGRPIGPMLAQTAAKVRDEALARLGGEAGGSSGSSTARASRSIAAVDDVGIFTRTLDDVTARLPEIVDYVSGSAGSGLRRRRRGDRAHDRTGDRIRSRSPPLGSDLATRPPGRRGRR